MVVQYILPYITQDVTFQALYGRAPPMLAELLIPADDSDHSLLPNSTTEAISIQIKANLQKAQERMKMQADRNRSDT
jgi:hypothetical protein